LAVYRDCFWLFGYKHAQTHYAFEPPMLWGRKIWSMTTPYILPKASEILVSLELKIKNRKSIMRQNVWNQYLHKVILHHRVSLPYVSEWSIPLLRALSCVWYQLHGLFLKWFMEKIERGLDPRTSEI